MRRRMEKKALAVWQDPLFPYPRLPIQPMFHSQGYKLKGSHQPT